jgi:AraC-like DNA-binding protein
LILPHHTQERTKFWRVEQITGLNLLHATYITQNFSRHMHDCFAVGVVEQGVQAYYYRGAHHIASPGCIVSCNPGEVHDGHAGTDEGWTYRMFYPDIDILKTVAAEVTGKQRDIPFVRETVIHDPELAHHLHGLHTALENPGALVLEQQSSLLSAFGLLITRYAYEPLRSRRLGAEPGPIERARAFLDDNWQRNISLDELAAVACLSPFYLVRVFSKEVGLAPHAYLIQTRIKRACHLLRLGLPIVQVAVDTGFVDQSHLHRHFRRIMGITPGVYQRAVAP